MELPAWDAVVVTLSGGERLRRAIASIAAQSPAPASIVVVVNGTADRDLPELSGVRLLRLPRNVGFATGSNRGIAEGGSPFVALVNDDVVLDAGWAAALLSAATEPAIASLSGEVRDREGRRIDSLGIELRASLSAVPIGAGSAAGGRRDLHDVPGVSATAALYRRAALPTPPFVAAFFAWYEDVDLALRLAREGHRAVVVPAATARHEGTATGSRMPFRRFRLLARNRRWTIARNLDAEALRALSGTNLVADAFTLRVALRQGPTAAAGAIFGILEAHLRAAPEDSGSAPRISRAALGRLAAT